MHATAASKVDQAVLEAEIVAARESFRTLVLRLPDTLWHHRAPGTKWTGRQLLHHVTWALEQLPAEVESAKREKGMFNYPKFLADSGSYWLVKWEARKETRETLLTRYDVAVSRVLGSLAQVEPTEWHRGARFYGEGFYSVADLFHTPAKHLQEHSAALLSAADT
jgi:hypothetical protein